MLTRDSSVDGRGGGRLLVLGLTSVLVALLTFSSFQSTSALGAQNRASRWRSTPGAVGATAVGVGAAPPELAQRSAVAQENEKLKEQIARLQQQLDGRNAAAMHSAAAAATAKPQVAAMSARRVVATASGEGAGYEGCEQVAPYNASLDDYRLTCKLIRSHS